MWKLFSNIFGSVSGSDVIQRMDDWNLSKEETVKYQLQWLSALPTGFQLAQRFIGIAFSIVFLIMVLTTFVLLALGREIQVLMEFIEATMMNPIMIIFSLFFGGGLINSFKGVVNPSKITSKSVSVESDTNVPKPTRKELRKAKRR